MGRDAQTYPLSITHTLVLLGITVLIALLLCSCTQVSQVEQFMTDEPVADTPYADVVSVEVSGDPGSYTFSVEISSPDLGCNQYADWWEVIDGDGNLVYRRVLTHSHANEQPFTRAGGPVEIDPDMPVYIRAHMHPGGYGGRVFQGSVEDGFSASMLSPGFADDLESVAPLPESCAF